MARLHKLQLPAASFTVILGARGEGEGRGLPTPLPALKLRSVCWGAGATDPQPFVSSDLLCKVDLTV